MQPHPSEKFRFLFFTDLVGKKVVAADGQPLGRLADLVAVSGEPYPPVESLVVRSGRRLSHVPWSAVESMNGTVRLLPGAVLEEVSEAPVADRLRLGQEILDRQIVDIEGAKLVRVNDLHFLETKGQLRVAHVDVGLRGLVRRLGWQRPVDGVVSTFRPSARYLTSESLLSWKLVQPIESAPGRVRVEATKKALASLHPADLAEIMEDLDRHQREVLFQRLDVETAADALEETSTELATELLEAVPPEKAADILEEMAPDEAADALSELPGDTRAELLQAMERPEAAEVAELLEYHPRSAGGLMTPDLVELPPTATVADAFAEVRRRAEELPLVYEIFLVENGLLRGLVTLKDLVVAIDPSATLGSLLREVPASVTADADVREVARAASKYNLLSVPVVDEAGAIMGMVTVDDILAEVVDAG
jgi:CBS domain-containing protein/sporulation protein YlmC with PRC-barrel domain